MDRYEKSSEQIMERGDRILAEKANKAKMIKRFSLSGAGVIAATIVGVFALHSAPSAPERIPVVSEVISTTSGYVSDTVTTVSSNAQTKAYKTTVATTPTTVKAKELTTNISRSEMTAADTTSQATQTIIVVSAERVTESSHSDPISTSQSSTATVTRSGPFKSLPMSGTASDTTAASEITTTTFSEPKNYNTASIPSNKLSDIIGYGKEIVYNETVYTSDYLDYSTEIIDGEIGEYSNIPVYSLKMFSPKIKITFGINDKFYSFSNKNYSVNNLKEFIIDNCWEQSGNYIEYGINEIRGEKADHAINDILFADAEKSVYSETTPFLSEKQAMIYSNSPFSIVIYENGYLESYINGKMIYFQIGEEKARSFFEYLDQTE